MTATPAPSGQPAWQPSPAQPVPLAPSVLSLAQSALQQGGAGRVVLRLDPPELGSVVLTLVVRGSDVHVSLVAADAGCTAPLDLRREQVRDALAAAGLDLAGWDIGAGGQSRPRNGADATARQGVHRGQPEAEAQTSPDRVSRGLFL